MCQIEVIIRLKETGSQQVMSETTLVSHAFEMLNLDAIPRTERVDRMEEITMQEGWQIMRQLYLKQWEAIEQRELQRRLSEAGSQAIQLDGKE